MNAEANYKPFEVVEEDGRTVLRLRGTGEQRVKVEADRVNIIMDAIVQGWDIDIWYADIDGDLDIRTIASKLERTEDGNLVVRGNIRMARCNISGNAHFGSAQFSGAVVFESAQFSGNAVFESAQFPIWNVDFVYAHFSGYANFVYAHFSGYANFGSAEFSRYAYFGSAEFSGYANFGFAQFGRDASFRYAHFSGYADFKYARFSGYADFKSAEFSGYANFGFAQFSGHASFRDTQFAAEGLASFASIKTLRSMDFSSSVFRCPVLFTGARFGGLLNLRRSIVIAPISMLAASFAESSGEFNLFEAIFSVEIDVSWKQIEAPFLKCLEQFLQEVPSQEEYDKEARLGLAQAALVQLSRNFTRLGRTKDARFAGYEGMLLERRGLGKWQKFRGRLLDFPSRRGTRPWRPLWFGLRIVVVFAAFFVILQAFKSSPDAAPYYYPFLYSLENFLPIMKPKLIGEWKIIEPAYEWLAQLEAIIGWAWLGLTAWSIRESFFQKNR